MVKKKPSEWESAISLLQTLPKEKRRTALDFLRYLHDREAWEATWELLSDPKIAQSLRRSGEDIRKGWLKH